MCDGKSLPKGDPAAVYLLRPFGNQAHEIWNTADPAHPVLVTRIVEGLKGTHKSWWECDAGVRAVDIRDPYHPKEIASYIPAVTLRGDQRCAKLENGQEHCAKAIQTNNVEVDDRGYIYIVDRANNGMHIIELTGPARGVADFPK